MTEGKWPIDTSILCIVRYIKSMIYDNYRGATAISSKWGRFPGDGI